MDSSPREPIDARASADYNLRVLWPLARWVEDHGGPGTLATLASQVCLEPRDFELTDRRISAAAFEHLLSGVRQLVATDDEFKRACAHRIRETCGPLRHVRWALSPAIVLAKTVASLRLVTAAGEGELTRLGRTSVRVRLPGTFGRLACLFWQAQCEALPTVWGLPRASVQALSRIAHGDPASEWRVDWHEHRGWAPSAVGAVGLAVVGLLFARLGLATVPTPAVLAIIGAAVGYILEIRRAERIDSGTRERVNEALRRLASDEAEARREIVDLSHRRKEWSRLVEKQVGERRNTLEEVISGAQDLQRERVSRVLGFSHDLRNPLQVIQFGTEMLRLRCKSDEYLMGIVGDMDQSIGQMKRMLGELVTTASVQQQTTLQFFPRRIEIPELAVSLQRRVRALAHGRDVQTSVFGTREVPAIIEIDPLFLDRIMDNLLTNAAKYTERGTIVVELDGSPGFLVLKVSDTGCGIDPQAMESIFTPGGSSVDSRRGDSFGVGLSVVVQLLDQIGGRLEVASQPGEGTTFWVHLPLHPAGGAPASGARPCANGTGTTGRVVKVHETHGLSRSVIASPGSGQTGGSWSPRERGGRGRDPAAS